MLMSKSELYLIKSVPVKLKERLWLLTFKIFFSHVSKTQKFLKFIVYIIPLGDVRVFCLSGTKHGYIFVWRQGITNWNLKENRKTT